MAADKNTPALVLVLCRCVQRLPTSLGEAALCSGGLSSSKEQPELSSTLCPLLPEFILLPAPPKSKQLIAWPSILFFNTMRKAGGVSSVGLLQFFWWVSKGSSGISDSFSQTTSLARGREMDVPVPVLGRERHNRDRLTHLGLFHLLWSLGLEQKAFIH